MDGGLSLMMRIKDGILEVWHSIELYMLLGIFKIECFYNKAAETTQLTSQF